MSGVLVRFLWAEPSVFIAQMSTPLAKAILVPSDDQAGSLSVHAEPSVVSLLAEPSAFIIHIPWPYS